MYTDLNVEDESFDRHGRLKNEDEEDEEDGDLGESPLRLAHAWRIRGSRAGQDGHHRSPLGGGNDDGRPRPR